MADRNRHVGNSYSNEEMSMNLVSIMPKPMPTSSHDLNCDVDFPAMSPMLLFFENFMLMAAREAAERIMNIFLPALAVEAKNKKYCGH